MIFRFPYRKERGVRRDPRKSGRGVRAGSQASGSRFSFEAEDRQAHINSYTFYLRYQRPLPTSNTVKVDLSRGESAFPGGAASGSTHRFRVDGVLEDYSISLYRPE
jgi:hypothetical protein